MLRDSEDDCQAQATATTAPLDARVQDLAANWRPSGYFEPEAMRAAVASVQAALSSAFDALAQAKSNCDLAPGCSFPTWGDRYAGLLAATDQATKYIAACDSAETSLSSAVQTAYVIAPGFKTWALDALQRASFAVNDSTISSCLMPWWASAAVVVVRAISAAADVLERVLGVAADVVEAAYKTGKAVVAVAAEGFSLLSWTINNAPLIVGLAVLVLGGGYAWKHRDALKTQIARLKRA